MRWNGIGRSFEQDLFRTDSISFRRRTRRWLFQLQDRLFSLFGQSATIIVTIIVTITIAVSRILAQVADPVSSQPEVAESASRPT